MKTTAAPAPSSRNRMRTSPSRTVSTLAVVRFRLPKKSSHSGYERPARASSAASAGSELGGERQARDARELGGDLAARLPEHREALAHDPLLGDLARVARAVERGNHPAVLVVHRDR